MSSLWETMVRIYCSPGISFESYF